MPATFTTIRTLLVIVPARTPIAFTAVNAISTVAASTRMPPGPSGTNDRST